jgi:hypothetical protein
VDLLLKIAALNINFRDPEKTNAAIKDCPAPLSGEPQNVS